MQTLYIANDILMIYINSIVTLHVRYGRQQTLNKRTPTILVHEINSGDKPNALMRPSDSGVARYGIISPVSLSILS